MPFVPLLSLNLIDSISATNINNRADRGKPWLITLHCVKLLENSHY